MDIARHADRKWQEETWRCQKLSVAKSTGKAGQRSDRMLWNECRRSEIPETELRQMVQEFQIGGTSRGYDAE
jgi:hypothetical protein